TKEDRVIDMVQVHERQYLLDQRRIILLRLDESKLGPHQLHVPSFAEGCVAVECGLQIFLLGQREQRLRQTAEIPETDIGLLIKIGRASCRERALVCES